MATVFISHRGDDSAEAGQLEREVTAAGHTVWLDALEIGLGDSIVEKINQGLEGSAYVVLCLSASGFSDWMNREWMSALARQLNGAGVKLLPVRLTGGTPPALLADIKYADLVKNWAAGMAELLKAIR